MIHENDVVVIDKLKRLLKEVTIEYYYKYSKINFEQLKCYLLAEIYGDVDLNSVCNMSFNCHSLTYKSIKFDIEFETYARRTYVLNCDIHLESGGVIGKLPLEFLTEEDFII